MDTKLKLESALRDAMKANNNSRKRTIRMVLAGIKLSEIDFGKSLDDEGVFGVLQKEVKSRREAIEDAKLAHRSDLITEAEGEIVILEEFLPAQFSEEELLPIVKQVIAELSASGLRDMGKVIKEVMLKVQGRASGNSVSQIVRSQLENM